MTTAPRRDHSAQYPRRILLAVTGLSPQVVTETLYALVRDRSPAFVPTEVHLVTTREGAERARLALLSDRPGWFHQLRKDYGLPEMRVDADTIHVLVNGTGQPLADIRTPEDNERAADLMSDLVRRLTSDGDSALHVSIAGGRKTMGYYAGYALSLYGRAQDRLSHVLVSEPFESSWDFFYPTPYESIITTRENKLANCADARVTLAEIPFVRLRDGLPRELLGGEVRFSEAVSEAQKALPPLALVLDPASRKVTAGGEALHLKPADFAFYWWMAERHRKELPGVHWSEKGIEGDLLAYYARLVNPNSGDYERAEKAFARGFTKDNFDPRKTHINKALEQALGRRRAQPYLIAALDSVPGARYRRYGLALPAEAVRIA